MSLLLAGTASFAAKEAEPGSRNRWALSRVTSNPDISVKRKVGDGVHCAITYFARWVVVHVWRSARKSSIRRTGWPGMRRAVPLLTGLVLAAGCASGGEGACGVALPWVHVINQDEPTITVHLYDGAAPVLIPTDTERVVHPSFGTPSLPSPPWHLTVRDAATGRLIIERQLVANDAIREVTVRRNSATIRPTTLPSTGGRC